MADITSKVLYTLDMADVGFKIHIIFMLKTVVLLTFCF
jgi:hypothetical protein